VTGRSAEVVILASMSVFGLLVGTGYWFLTYEVAGTLLLIGFGIATGLGAAVIVALSGSEPGTPRGGTSPIPRPGWAPFALGLGLGGLALGAVFGPWLAIGAILLALVGGWIWLSMAMGEADPRREIDSGDD